MTGDNPRYELHFHGLVQDSIAVDYKKVTEIFQYRLHKITPPHQLPPDLKDFTSRQAEGNRILTQLQQVTLTGEIESRISIVTGMAGVGKSTLALHVAHQLKSDFPDAQLYVNLRGTEGQPLEPLEVLAGFLRVLGVNEASIPQRLTERSELYRSLLSEKRVLILLDNARDEFQIRPLLPENVSCAVLVTTRRRFTGFPEETILELSGMTEDEGISLLYNLIDVDQKEAESEVSKTIIEFCDRVPLAIRIASGILNNKPEWQLSDYANKLADERGRLENLRLSDLGVRANLTLSYQELSEIPARLFRLLGLLVGLNIEPEVAVALLELDPEIAADAFKTLVKIELLEVGNEGRYYFHDLVRLFARGHLAQEEPAEARQAARLRVSRWYLETAEIADLALNPETRRQLASVSINGKDRANIIERNLLLTALNWFEMERSNLLAAVEWAHQAEAWEIVVSLARNLVNFFNANGYWADWERSHGLGLEASRELGNHQGEAETLINLGNVYSLQGNWEKASNCYEQSLGIFSELNNRPGVAKSLSNLGNVYSQQNSWEKGIDRYKQSLEIFEDLDDSYRGGQTLANMGIFYAQQNDLENAVRFWQKSLTKLHPDLPKSKRVTEWLQSIKGSASPQTIESKPRGKLSYILGASILIIILILFLLFIFW